MVYSGQWYSKCAVNSQTKARPGPQPLLGSGVTALADGPRERPAWQAQLKVRRPICSGKEKCMRDVLGGVQVVWELFRGIDLLYILVQVFTTFWDPCSLH